MIVISNIILDHHGERNFIEVKIKQNQELKFFVDVNNVNDLLALREWYNWQMEQQKE